MTRPAVALSGRLHPAPPTSRHLFRKALAVLIAAIPLWVLIVVNFVIQPWNHVYTRITTQTLNGYFYVNPYNPNAKAPPLYTYSHIVVVITNHAKNLMWGLDWVVGTALAVFLLACLIVGISHLCGWLWNTDPEVK